MESDLQHFSFLHVEISIGLKLFTFSSYLRIPTDSLSHGDPARYTFKSDQNLKLSDWVSQETLREI